MKGSVSSAMTKETGGKRGGLIMIGHEEKKGAGPLSLEICPLPEEPWMDGFQMGVVTIEA